MNKVFSSSYLNIAALLFAGCFFAVGCENSDKEIKQLTEKRVSVDEAKQVESFMSQDGKMKAKLSAPQMLRYANMNDSPYYEFPKSLHVDFYNDSAKKESRLDARYGRYNDQQDKVFLRDSVVVINLEKGDTLYCDELWWDQKKEIFYTEKKVRIRTKNEILDGVGMDAKQNFSEWYLHKVVGIIKYQNQEF